MESIISANELIDTIDKEAIVLIEASSGATAQQQFEDEHLQNALFVDLDRDLSQADDPARGGRHPLPNIKEFSKLLGTLGITPDSRVVVYDRANGANAAARFWWMLRAIGHKEVQVLSGGFTYAITAGFPVSVGRSVYLDGNVYPFTDWILPTSDMQQVDQSTNDTKSLIIDVREQKRYNGQIEPIDLVAGHIPSAVNIPLTENLNQDGLFKSPKELQALYEPFLQGKDQDKVIVHCGSGVTACHTILALDYAGYEIPSLYVGSWSEWSRNDNPIITND